MKKYLLNITLLTLVTLLGACEKGIESYENDPRVYFFERNTDANETRITSKSFSFLSFASTVTRDTFLVKVKIMGFPTTSDRVVRGEVIAQGTTAVAGQHYLFIDGTVKAGAIIGYIPVVLFRTSDIKTTAVQLNLKIAETKDFKPGVAEDNFFSITWSDNIIKPSNWDGSLGLAAFFGAYSEVKFRFIIDVLGISDFPLQTNRNVPLQPGQYSSTAMLDFKARVKLALLDYNNSHTVPLTDENNALVTFPN